MKILLRLLRNYIKLWQWNYCGAGNYKERETYLINSNENEINFTKPQYIVSRMEEVKQKYENEWQQLTVFERAVRLHMAITNIHSFIDGNGRIARLIMN